MQTDSAAPGVKTHPRQMSEPIEEFGTAITFDERTVRFWSICDERQQIYSIQRTSRCRRRTTAGRIQGAPDRIGIVIVHHRDWKIEQHIERRGGGFRPADVPMHFVSLPANFEADAVTAPFLERGEPAALLLRAWRCAKHPAHAHRRSLAPDESAGEQRAEIRGSLRAIVRRQPTRDSFRHDTSLVRRPDCRSVFQRARSPASYLR